MEPFYDHEGITIYCADWRDVLPQLGGGLDLAVADPLYNVGYSYDTVSDNLPDEDYLAGQLEMAERVDELLKPGGQFFYLNYPEFAARMFCAVPEVTDLLPYELITWIYNQHTGGRPLRKASRLWCWFTKGEPGYVEERELEGEYRNPTDRRVAALIGQGRKPVGYDWWHYEQVKNVSAEKLGHPCQLPLAMVSRIVRLACPPGGLVVDPFMGSGTTAEACLLNGRRFVGCDLSENYCAEAVKRLKQPVLAMR
jgi:site-specific DNA-methyltransferase (adenine-specific)